MSILEITADEYHADQLGQDDRSSLSASIAKLLITSSPAHARAAHPRLNPFYVRTEDEKFDVGRAAHAIFLEGEDRIVEVHADSWRTKRAQEERDAARAAGFTPLLAEQAFRVREMVEAIRAQIDQVDDQGMPFFSGKAETPIMWETDGVLCRALLDNLRVRPGEIPVVDDLKTTSGSAAPERWSRGPFYDRGFDVQSEFHSLGVATVLLCRPIFRYVVVETAPPYALQVFTPGPDVQAVAEAKVAFAIRAWRRCLETDVWPAYPAKVATIELPPWEEPRWLEREAREAA